MLPSVRNFKRLAAAMSHWRMATLSCSEGKVTSVVPRWIFNLPSGVEGMAAAASQSGSLIAAACRDGTLRLLSCDSGVALSELHPPTSGVLSSAAATCVQFR